MESSEHFIIKSSPIHGLGLFATVTIPRGSCVGFYVGKKVLARHVRELNLDRTYMMQLKRGRYYIDGSNLQENPMGYINHSNTSPNVYYRELLDGRVQVRAMRNISPGEELLADYGYDPAAM